MKTILTVAVFLILATATVEAASLMGSMTSVRKQHQVAKNHFYTFLPNARMVRDFVRKKLLVPVRGNANLRVAPGVSHPFTRPSTKLFIDRLSAQYRRACGEKLVITSLTRPLNQQPSNASRYSVHPTGMSVDIRVPGKRKCRDWLERTFLTLEDAGVIEATRERRPPHYHVAVFPTQYTRYVAKRR